MVKGRDRDDQAESAYREALRQFGLAEASAGAPPRSHKPPRAPVKRAVTGRLWAGSVGVRAVELLRAFGPGFIIPNPEFALLLGVQQIRMHMLLANVVELRLLRKVRIPDRRCMGWTLGPGQERVSIGVKQVRDPGRKSDRRVKSAGDTTALAGGRREADPPTPAPLPVFFRDPSWPPKFVSRFDTVEITDFGTTRRTKDDDPAT